MENDGNNFIMRTTPGTVALQFAALVLIATVQEPSGKAFEENGDNSIKPAIRPRLSLKSGSGRKRLAKADLSHKFPSSATRLTREKQAFTTAFKMGVLLHAT